MQTGAQQAAEAASTSEILALNLRRLRERTGKSQQWLADRSQVARSTIARIEGGRYEGARTGTLQALAVVLGVNVSAFFAPPRSPAR